MLAPSVKSQIKSRPGFSM